MSGQVYPSTMAAGDVIRRGETRVLEPAAHASGAVARIAYAAPAYWRLLAVDIAAELKHRHGSEIHCYQTTPQNVSFFSRHGSAAFAEVRDSGVLHKAVRAERPADIEAIVARALADEERLGVTYNTLAMADRHLGRGFSPLGTGHPRSHLSETVDYFGVLHALSEQIEFWERELDEKKITLVVTPSKIMAVIARSRGIPIRVLASSRYKNFHMWGDNEYWDTPRVARAFERIPGADPVTVENSYAKDMADRAKAFERTRLTSLIGISAKLVAQKAYWQLRGYEKARGYFLGDNLHFVYDEWRDLRRELRAPRIRLKDLEGQRFVFYPLHEEPESALTIGSPEYLNQFAAIMSIARDLPAGVLCVVKDTIHALGRRPRNFYAQLHEFKNVRLMHIAERGLEVVRKADAVVTITGTAGFEAAVLGVPVISLGRHNLFGFLAHVAVPRSEEEFGEKLRWALSPALDRELAKIDGARFLHAVLAESVDFGSYSPENLAHLPPDVVVALVERLVASLSA